MRNKLSAEPDFFILLFLLILFCDSGFLLLFSAAVIAHEAGHILALRLCGAAAERIVLRFFGVTVGYGEEKLSPGKSAVCAAAGPAASLFLAIAAATYGRVSGNGGAFLLAGISFVLFAFNMLPVYALDGGRILYFTTLKYLGGDAETFLLYTGLAVSLLFILGGIAMYKAGFGNIVVPAAGVIIAVSCCKKYYSDIE